MKRSARPFILFVLALLLGLAVAAVCDAQETASFLDGTHLKYTGPQDAHGVPILEVQDFRDVTHDYAKLLPPELYYHWALAHNAREEARVHRSMGIDASVISSSSSVTGRMPPSRGITSSSNGGRFNANAQSKTVTRYVRPQVYGKPSMIYNPYFKGK